MSLNASAATYASHRSGLCLPRSLLQSSPEVKSRSLCGSPQPLIVGEIYHIYIHHGWLAMFRLGRLSTLGVPQDLVVCTRVSLILVGYTPSYISYCIITYALLASYAIPYQYIPEPSGTFLNLFMTLGDGRYL